MLGTISLNRKENEAFLSPMTSKANQTIIKNHDYSTHTFLVINAETNAQKMPPPPVYPFSQTPYPALFKVV